MQSRLLSNLLGAARETGDRKAWARNVCRAASHFARQGSVDSALASISAVRTEFKDDLEPEVACWLMLAEGILNFFRMNSRSAYDRTQRAYALSKALKLHEVMPACAAWMAHLEFNANQYDRMTAHLHESLTNAQIHDHQAGARASLVLADAYHFAGSFEEAQPWYTRCRLHATAEGDDATLSAMLHNVAAFRASNVRLADAFDVFNPTESHRAWLEAQSAYAYDSAVGTTGLQLLLPLLRGQILSVERKYGDAIKLLQSINLASIHGRLIPLIHADLAWCLAAEEKLDEAWHMAGKAKSSIAAIEETDDYAYTCARISITANACGYHAEFTSWKRASLEAYHKHRECQASLLSSLRRIGPFPTNSIIFGHK